MFPGAPPAELSGNSAVLKLADVGDLRQSWSLSTNPPLLCCLLASPPSQPVPQRLPAASIWSQGLPGCATPASPTQHPGPAGQQDFCCGFAPLPACKQALTPRLAFLGPAVPLLFAFSLSPKRSCWRKAAPSKGWAISSLLCWQEHFPERHLSSAARASEQGQGDSWEIGSGGRADLPHGGTSIRGAATHLQREGRDAGCAAPAAMPPTPALPSSLTSCQPPTPVAEDRGLSQSLSSWECEEPAAAAPQKAF